MFVALFLLWYSLHFQNTFFNFVFFKKSNFSTIGGPHTINFGLIVLQQFFTSIYLKNHVIYDHLVNRWSIKRKSTIMRQFHCSIRYFEKDNYALIFFSRNKRFSCTIRNDLVNIWSIESKPTIMRHYNCSITYFEMENYTLIFWKKYRFLCAILDGFHPIPTASLSLEVISANMQRNW